MWTADHISRRREAVDESGEQPEKQPNRLAVMTGSKRPRALPKEKDRTNSAVKTLCTLCCACQATQTQQPRQQQQPQHPRECDDNDPLDPRRGMSMACGLVYRSDAVPLDCLAATVMWISCQPGSLCPGSLNVSPTTE